MSVIKLYVAMGSQKEYLLVHGKTKPIVVGDLKEEIARAFKIPPEQQFILFRGNNLHEYVDETPLETFGLENNCPIAVWTKGTHSEPDVRLPKEAVKMSSSLIEKKVLNNSIITSPPKMLPNG